MKLSKIQMILGIIVILLSCCIVGWVLFAAPDLHRLPVRDENGEISMVVADIVNGEIFMAARVTSGLLLALGLATLIASVYQFTRQRGGEAIQKKLVVIQIFCGLLIVAGSIFVTTWGYPTSLASATPVLSPDGTEGLMHVFWSPGPLQVLTQLITSIIPIFGLGIAGCGIAQLLKSRRFQVKRAISQGAG